MKKAYNYITIVKTDKGIMLGKNSGTSCNRRNAMDKAHNRPAEIIAAVNLLNPLCKDSLGECLEMVQVILSAKGCNLLRMPLEVITTFIGKTAKELGYAKDYIAYTEKPVKWSY